MRVTTKSCPDISAGHKLKIFVHFSSIHVKEHFASQNIGFLVYSFMDIFQIAKMSKLQMHLNMGWTYGVMGETQITASKARVEYRYSKQASLY